MTNEQQKAREMLMKAYEKCQEQARVSPAWLANMVMKKLDPKRESNAIEYALAQMELRQMAREICRVQFESDDESAIEQHELWPGLQKRYPASRSTDKQDPEYVLLEQMSALDVKYNCRRLRSEAAAKEAHADRLEEWWTKFSRATA